MRIIKTNNFNRNRRITVSRQEREKQLLNAIGLVSESLKKAQYAHDYEAIVRYKSTLDDFVKELQCIKESK